MRWLVILLLVPLASAVPSPDDAPHRFDSVCLEEHARRFVYDYTDLLSLRGGQAIERQHCITYQSTSVHFVVVVAEDDEGDIERFAIELFEEWGIGDKERLDGLLLVLAPSDAGWASRLEVGYGIEDPVNAVVARDALAHGEEAYNATVEGGGSTGEALEAFIDAVDDAVIPLFETHGAVAQPRASTWPVFVVFGVFFLIGSVYLSRTMFRKTNEWGDVEHTRMDHFFAGLTWREGDWVPSETHAAYKAFRWGRRLRYISFIILIVTALFGRRVRKGGFGGGRSGGGGGTGRF